MSNMIYSDRYQPPSDFEFGPVCPPSAQITTEPGGDIVLRGADVVIEGNLTGRTIDQIFNRMQELEKRIKELEESNPPEKYPQYVKLS